MPKLTTEHSNAFLSINKRPIYICHTGFYHLHFNGGFRVFIFTIIQEYRSVY